MGAVIPFTVHEPSGEETPVVVEVPHAGLQVDPQTLAYLAAPARAIGRDADLFVDELFTDAPAVGAHLLVAHLSRYVCDLNRSEDEIDGSTVEGGAARRAPHGLIWRTTTDGITALAAPLPRAELERRLTSFYRPYHAQLSELLARKREQFGFAVLLCAHSMPSRGLPGGELRADVVPGSQGRTTAASALIDLPDKLAHSYGWSVAHDHPYRGGFTTRHYGRPLISVHALQLELSRRLYMDELRLTPRRPDFDRTRLFCRELVARAGKLALGSAGQ